MLLRPVSILPFVQKSFLAMICFTFAYLTTITVNAQQQETIVTGDTIHIDNSDNTIVSGVIDTVDDGVIELVSGETRVRIGTRNLNLKSPAEDIFKPGMNITVKGDMEKGDFGTMVVDADNITMSTNPSATYLRDPQ